MYRRKWATEREDLPLKALMEAGGWKDLQTLVTCYQHPSDESILRVMAHPVKLRERKTAAAREKLLRNGCNWVREDEARRESS